MSSSKTVSKSVPYGTLNRVVKELLKEMKKTGINPTKEYVEALQSCVVGTFCFHLPFKIITSVYILHPIRDLIHASNHKYTVFIRKLTNSALEEARKRSNAKKKKKKGKVKMKMMNPEDVVNGLASIDMSALKDDLEAKLVEIKKDETEQKNRKRKRKLAQPSEEELKEQQRKLFEAATKAMMQSST